MSAIGDKIVNNLQSFADTLKHKKFEEITPQEARKLWIDDLRSGKHKQAKEVLCRIGEDGPSYCCLGRICELFIEHGGKLNKKLTDGYTCYKYGEEEYTGILPAAVQEWIGMRDLSGTFSVPVTYKDADGDFSNSYTLTSLNDKASYTFEQIADFVEKEPKGLFATTSPTATD